MYSIFIIFIMIGLIIYAKRVNKQKEINEKNEHDERNNIYKEQCKTTVDAAQRQIEALNNSLEEYRKEWE